MKMRKEGELIIQVSKYVLLFMGLCISCNTYKKVSNSLMTSDLEYDSLIANNRLSEPLIYDTIDAMFYYENSILSYVNFDVIAKSGGLVICDSVLSRSYFSGYYIPDGHYIAKLLQYERNLYINYNLHSIGAFHDSLIQDGIRNNNILGITDINPYCEVYYKKYHIKMEVLYIGMLKQRLPLFLNCREYKRYVKRHGGVNYQVAALPTYIITNIFNWEKI